MGAGGGERSLHPPNDQPTKVRADNAHGKHFIYTRRLYKRVATDPTVLRTVL